MLAKLNRCFAAGLLREDVLNLKSAARVLAQPLRSLSLAISSQVDVLGEFCQNVEQAKSDVSAAGNAWAMSQAVCPLASRGMLAESRSTPFRINSQRTSPGLDSRLWIATPVVMPPSWRRTGRGQQRAGGLPAEFRGTAGEVSARLACSHYEN